MSLSITYTVQVDPQIAARLQREVTRRLLQTGAAIRDKVVVNLANQPPRSGNIYRVPGTNVKYTASAIGEYPALRTGALRQSVRMVHMDANQVAIGTDILYGLFLEKKLATRGGRPWLGRTAREADKMIQQIWHRPWDLSR
jgi:hypothetical protein